MTTCCLAVTGGVVLVGAGRTYQYYTATVRQIKPAQLALSAHYNKVILTYLLTHSLTYLLI